MVSSSHGEVFIIISGIKTGEKGTVVTGDISDFLPFRGSRTIDAGRSADGSVYSVSSGSGSLTCRDSAFRGLQYRILFPWIKPRDNQPSDGHQTMFEMSTVWCVVPGSAFVWVGDAFARVVMRSERTGAYLCHNDQWIGHWGRTLSAGGNRNGGKVMDLSVSSWKGVIGGGR